MTLHDGLHIKFINLETFQTMHRKPVYHNNSNERSIDISDIL